MSNVKSVTRDRHRSVSESEDDSTVSIPVLISKTKTMLQKEDAKERFDAALFSSSSSDTSASAAVQMPVNENVSAVGGAVSNQSNWEQVPFQKTQRNVRPQSLVDYLNVATRNSYDALTEESLDIEDMDTMPAPNATQQSTGGDCVVNQKNQRPPPICFASRMEQHYGEFRAPLDAISRDYYHGTFSGGKTLVPLDAISRDYYHGTFSGGKTLVY
ncbi:hypothetical protein QE152_g27411 [Popillia japonica]|uniref:Uncharacterized protein n=1 Tax=Popillia japonica TaxID=7064 RepID=A0AAW1JVJ8_POPJA